MVVDQLKIIVKETGELRIIMIHSQRKKYKDHRARSNEMDNNDD